MANTAGKARDDAAMVEALAARIGPTLTRFALNEVARMGGPAAPATGTVAPSALARASALLDAVVHIQGLRFTKDQLAQEQEQWVTQGQIFKSIDIWASASEWRLPSLDHDKERIDDVELQAVPAEFREVRKDFATSLKDYVRHHTEALKTLRQNALLVSNGISGEQEETESMADTLLAIDPLRIESLDATRILDQVKQKDAYKELEGQVSSLGSAKGGDTWIFRKQGLWSALVHNDRDLCFEKQIKCSWRSDTAPFTGVPSSGAKVFEACRRHDVYGGGALTQMLQSGLVNKRDKFRLPGSKRPSSEDDFEREAISSCVSALDFLSAALRIGDAALRSDATGREKQDRDEELFRAANRLEKATLALVRGRIRAITRGDRAFLSEAQLHALASAVITRVSANIEVFAVDPRENNPGTWITQGQIDIALDALSGAGKLQYPRLMKKYGYIHSTEIRWEVDELFVQAFGPLHPLQASQKKTSFAAFKAYVAQTLQALRADPVASFDFRESKRAGAPGTPDVEQYEVVLKIDDFADSASEVMQMNKGLDGVKDKLRTAARSDAKDPNPWGYSKVALRKALATGNESPQGTLKKYEYLPSTCSLPWHQSVPERGLVTGDTGAGPLLKKIRDAFPKSDPAYGPNMKGLYYVEHCLMWVQALEDLLDLEGH